MDNVPSRSRCHPGAEKIGWCYSLRNRYPSIMIRRHLLTLAAFFILSALAMQAQQRPNVLFLTVDDLKTNLGAYGDSMAITPNIDRLADSGTVMLNNYCQQAVCAPSRMSMFTGLRPDTTKVWDLRTKIEDANPDAVTMQQWFREHGYVTAGAGKIMHGAKNEHPASWSVPYVDQKNLPFAEGFPTPAHDNVFYQNEKSQEVYREMNEKGISGWQARAKYMAENGGSPSMEFLDVPDDAYGDGALANWAIGQLEDFAKSREPFFLTVGFMKPHLPFVAPKKYWDMYDHDDIDVAEFRQYAANTPDWVYHKYGELRSYSDISRDWNESIDDETSRELIHAYYACTSYIDAQIGRVMAKLDELGLAENTIVVLWGDHGWHLGDHDMWCKHSNFENATRAPLIIHAPGYKPARAEGMTEFVDVFPTLLELANLEEPYKMEGASLVPIMENPRAEVKEFSISQYPRSQGRMGYALRDQRYRYVVWMGRDWRSTMPYDSSLVEFVELYDYEKDPLETVNVAEDPAYADVVADLNGKMLSYFKQYEQAPQQSTAYQGAAVVLGEGNEVIDLASVNVPSLLTRFASVSRNGDKLTLNYENSPKWPSVDFEAPGESPWDLSDFQAVDISLTNVSQLPVRVTAYFADPEDTNAARRRVGGREVIPAGATQNLRIDLTSKEYPVDLSRLSSLRIFVDKLTQPVAIDVNSVRAIKVAGSTQAAAPAKAQSAGQAQGEVVDIKPGGQLFNLAKANQETEVGLRFTDIQPAGNALMLNFELSPKWPSVEFHPLAGGVWDLSKYQTLEVSLTNESADKVKAFAFVASMGDTHQAQKRSSTKVDLAPGETQTLQLPLAGQPGAFDPSQVSEVRVFVGMHKAPVTLKLSSVKAL